MTMIFEDQIRLVGLVFIATYVLELPLYFYYLKNSHLNRATRDRFFLITRGTIAVAALIKLVLHFWRVQ